MRIILIRWYSLSVTPLHQIVNARYYYLLLASYMVANRKLSKKRGVAGNALNLKTNCKINRRNEERPADAVCTSACKGTAEAYGYSLLPWESSRCCLITLMLPGLKQERCHEGGETERSFCHFHLTGPKPWRKKGFVQIGKVNQCSIHETCIIHCV